MRANLSTSSRNNSWAARISDAVADDVVGAATAVVVVDGSATAAADAAAVRGSNGAAAGPMHVSGCMCTGGL